MEIELPDGTVLDAPDGADIKAVVRGYRLNQLKAKNPGEYDSNSPEFKKLYGSNPSKLEAFQSGLNRMNLGAGNLLRKMGPGAIAFTPQALDAMVNPTTTDEYLKKIDELDKPIKEERPISRGAGEITGGMVATAPIGGAGAASMLPTAVGRALGAGAGKALFEGALQGAMGADPDHQLAGAVKGAVLSAAMNKILGVGGKIVRGLVNKSEEAKALQQLAAQQGEDIFIPISQAASEEDLGSRAAKILYSEGLPLVPGVKTQLNRQAGSAMEKFRELALKEATPEGVPLPGNPGREVQESLASIRQGFGDAYDSTVGSLDFHIPQTLRSDVVNKMKDLDPNMDKITQEKGLSAVRDLLLRFGSKGKIEGSKLLVVRDQLRKLIDKAPDYEKAGFQAAHDAVEDMIAQRLSVQGLLPKYADLEEPSRHLIGLEAAARAARPNSGRFTPAQLARVARDPTQLDLAQTANAVLSQSPAGTSFAGRSLLGAAGLGGLSASAGLPAGAGVFIGANLLATKTAQKALMGDTAAQQAIVKLLTEHPEAAAQVERALRTAAATSGD